MDLPCADERRRLSRERSDDGERNQRGVRRSKGKGRRTLIGLLVGVSAMALLLPVL